MPITTRVAGLAITAVAVSSPAPPSPATPSFRELATTSNGKGRFAGVQVGAVDLGDSFAVSG